jgi:hypothetical protein
MKLEQATTALMWFTRIIGYGALLALIIYVGWAIYRMNG